MFHNLKLHMHYNRIKEKINPLTTELALKKWRTDYKGVWIKSSYLSTDRYLECWIISEFLYKMNLS